MSFLSQAAVAAVSLPGKAGARRKGVWALMGRGGLDEAQPLSCFERDDKVT